VTNRLFTLQTVTRQDVERLDFTDDRVSQRDYFSLAIRDALSP